MLTLLTALHAGYYQGWELAWSGNVFKNKNPQIWLKTGWKLNDYRKEQNTVDIKLSPAAHNTNINIW